MAWSYFTLLVSGFLSPSCRRRPPPPGFFSSWNPPIKGLVASTKTTEISRFQREQKQWNEDALRNHTLRVANLIFSSNVPNILRELTRTKETSYSNLNICCFLRVAKHQHLLHLCHLKTSPGPQVLSLQGWHVRLQHEALQGWPRAKWYNSKKTEMPMEVAWKLLVGGFNPSQNGFIFPNFRGEH